jgi:DHA1 family tetracycline resistance protein-like MFS transporter
MLNATFGIDFVVGPALGGGVLGNVNPRLPFWVAAGLSLLNGMYGLFVLPESLPVEIRKKPNWRRANPLGSLALFRKVHGLLPLAGLLLVGLAIASGRWRTMLRRRRSSGCGGARLSQACCFK